METPSAQGDDITAKTARAAKRALSRGEKWALRATIACGLLLLVAIPLLMRHNVIPNIVIPPPAPLPNPNAFNFYVRAGTMVRPAVNAVYDKNAPLSLLQSTVKGNAPALATVRKGFAFSYRPPSSRDPGQLSFTPYTRSHELARQFQIESRVLAKQGNWNGAMQSCLDGIRFGSDFPYGALFGAGMEATARKNAEKIVPHLSSGQARAAAKRLEALHANRASLVAIMQEGKWEGLASLKQMFATPNWRGVILDGYEDLTFGDKLQIELLSAETLVNNYTAAMDTQIANARLPYGAPQKPMPKNLDWYTEEVTSIYERSGFNYARNEAGNVLLLATLALRAFQAERGDLPRSLDELAPSYLARVPIDPFGRGRPLRYARKNAREYSLYSVGPDGRDDGGKPAKSSFQTGPRTNKPIDADSRGDAILGINI